MFKKIANSSIAIAKIAGKGVFKNFIFTGFSLIVFVVSLLFIIYDLRNNSGSGLSGAGHTGGAGAILAVFYFLSIDFWRTILCITSLLLFPVLYTKMINQGVIKSAIFELWKINLEDWFSSKIASFVKNNLNSDGIVSKVNDKATLKVKMLTDIKNDKSNSIWQRRIFSFILKKIQLDDFDMSQDNAKISDIIIAKATAYVSDMAEPDNRNLYITFGIQVLLIILAVLFNS